MKRLHVLASIVILSIFLAVTAAAAPGKAKKADIPKGVTNALKVMENRVARDKEMHQKLDKAQAIKEAHKGEGKLEHKKK